MVNVSVAPLQLLAVGLTFIVATTGAELVFVATKDGMFPEPLAASPIEVLLFVQLYVVPVTPPVNVTSVVEAPLHTAGSAITFVVGVGLTVIVKLPDGPAQLLAVGVTVIVAVTGVVPLLVAKKEAIFPVPLDARPMEVLLFVHANVVPDTPPLKLIFPVAALLHFTMFVNALSVGVGFTLIANTSLGPVQPLALGVTVIVEVTGDVELFTAMNELILPVPFAASPILMLLFTHE